MTVFHVHLARIVPAKDSPSPQESAAQAMRALPLQFHRNNNRLIKVTTPLKVQLKPSHVLQEPTTTKLTKTPVSLAQRRSTAQTAQ